MDRQGLVGVELVGPCNRQHYFIVRIMLPFKEKENETYKLISKMETSCQKSPMGNGALVHSLDPKVIPPDLIELYLWVKASFEASQTKGSQASKARPAKTDPLAKRPGIKIGTKPAIKKGVDKAVSKQAIK